MDNQSIQIADPSSIRDQKTSTNWWILVVLVIALAFCAEKIVTGGIAG